MNNLLQKAKRLLGGQSPEEANWDYCISHGLKVGKNFLNYSPYAFDANWPWLISIGDDVLLSSNVKILAYDASPCKAGIGTKVGIVEIGNNVFVGAGSTILCYVKIGDNVIIGAKSVVSHDIPSNSVVAGSPAKVIGTFEEYKEKHLKNTATHYFFRERQWNEWANAGEEAWEMMREKLKNGFGYV